MNQHLENYDKYDPVLTKSDVELLGELLPDLDERPGPARRTPSAISAVMVRSVIDAALSRTAADLSVSLPAQPAKMDRRFARRFLAKGRSVATAAGVLLTFSLGAGAAAVVGRLARAPVGRVEPPAALRHERPSDRLHLHQRPVAPPPDWIEVPAPAPIELPSAGAALKKHRSRPASPKLSGTPAGAPVGQEPLVFQGLDLSAAPPEDLLALANQQRREHRWSAADELYRAVSGRFPKSDAAVVAEIASASLHLEQLGDAAGALAVFQRSLSERPTGSLAEEARWGIVQAWRALGDEVAEVAALREFLNRHPNSALAAPARRRIAELAP